MARELTPHEIYKHISKTAKIPIDDVENIYLILVDFILSELKTYGHFKLPYVGKFKTHLRKGRWTHVPDNHNKGELKYIYMEPMAYLQFVSSAVFKKQFRGDRVSRYELKKQRLLVAEQKLKEEEFEKQKVIVEKMQNSVKNAVAVREEKMRAKKGLKPKPPSEDDGIEY